MATVTVDTIDIIDVKLECSMAKKTWNFVIVAGPKTALQNRLVLHLAHKLNDAPLRAQCLKQLDSTVEDQLSYAAVRVKDGEFQEAINTYRQLIIDNKSVDQFILYP